MSAPGAPAAGGGLAGFGSAAYGGPGWVPRAAPHGAELGTHWAPHRVAGEWQPLRAVLLRRPGAEIAVAEADAAQYLAPLDLALAQAEHDAMAAAYAAAGVEVLRVPEVPRPAPNRMFCADLFAMTPEGAILGRPASEVRAGEEVAVAAALAAAGVPILMTPTGRATFEGADLIWLDPRTALIGRGLRTNAEAIAQIGALFDRLGWRLIAVDMPYGTMHLMGMLRIADRDLAICWPRRTPHAAVEALRAAGYDTVFLPAEDEAAANRGLNFVTLGPRRVLMPAGNPAMRAFCEAQGIAVAETPAFELRKAAGAVGCLTGVLGRAEG